MKVFFAVIVTAYKPTKEVLIGNYVSLIFFPVFFLS